MCIQSAQKLMPTPKLGSSTAELLQLSAGQDQIVIFNHVDFLKAVQVMPGITWSGTTATPRVGAPTWAARGLVRVCRRVTNAGHKPAWPAWRCSSSLCTIQHNSYSTIQDSPATAKCHNTETIQCHNTNISAEWLYTLTDCKNSKGMFCSS